ncbi:MAG: glycoside hydrolase family 88 protein [Candidatus Pseudobacter hemicellulosilyticus]|uniref:Glycoside hydrolase family 88 protein n=1 Tax=Candidatus Pseudobacter hemicellulosilyticus TaxID=3121375 RepID=A0AAJ5WPG5_9BACT|nr:MAG: glycoside hydrolase family 88 protein [Pseudobacter sp.]
MNQPFTLLFAALLTSAAYGQQTASPALPLSEPPAAPLTLIRTVADKIIRETPFQFQLVLPANNVDFDFVKHVDLGRTYGLGKPCVAYALSQLESRSDTAFTVQVSHNDGLKIWINDQVVYERSGDRSVNVTPRERDIRLEYAFPVKLKKGHNRILVKSETRGKEWIFYLQPKGSLIEERIPGCPVLSLQQLPLVSAEVASLSNWLVIGPFANPEKNGRRTGLQTVYGPEKEFSIGQLYQQNGRDLSWTIPKVEVFADVINPRPYWGTYYNWNYHTGGVAWAMAHLSEVTGEKRYDDYSKRWTDFMLEKKPFIGYQVNTLNGFQSTHHHLFNTPLLDFTAAPALPFIYRINRDKQFSNRSAYVQFVSGIKDYVLKEQIRLPDGGNFTRETPRKYTTWVDDMFMSIPFIVQAALGAPSAREKDSLLNEAARQVLAFNEQVFDKTVNLYRHARYSTDNAAMPYWSRANGWGIWATTEVLENLPAQNPYRTKIMEYFVRHVDALVKWQNPQTGYWHNVLDRPDSYEEVSGTAIFTMAIARGINEGWLSREKYMPVALLGWKAIAASVEPDGTVHNICVGTMSSEDVNYYMTRPKIDDDSHGIIGLVFAAIEMDKLLKR